MKCTIIDQYLYSYSYILFVPFESSDNENSGIVYVWIGSKSTPEESKLIQEIAEDMFNNPWVSLQVCLSFLYYKYVQRILMQN